MEFITMWLIIIIITLFLFVFILVLLLHVIFNLIYLHVCALSTKVNSTNSMSNSTHSLDDTISTVGDSLTTLMSPPTYQSRMKAIEKRVSLWEQDSDNPYEDFRRSIQELIEVYPELAKSNNMNELFSQYLEYNSQNLHPFIVQAFIDFSVDLTLKGIV
ncbi:unnamed protein product [Sphenostylis stenocarpa]|uniref:Transcription repressor n=1 Tax=Sphenostylis stenocarpa TaxID=92480 RepID=A0AA86SAG2_9FABA|nr:unnamed protein product [Sphenostylis stenocarpa]